jgi:hypothetical protein
MLDPPPKKIMYPFIVCSQYCIPDFPDPKLCGLDAPTVAAEDLQSLRGPISDNHPKLATKLNTAVTSTQ